MSLTRHTLLAYILLLAITLLVIELVIAPVFANWQSQQQTTQALADDVVEARSTLSEIEQASTSAASEFATLFDSGAIGTTSHASDATHRLQERIKAVLNPRSATITQMRPSTEEEPDGLLKSKLEIDLRTNAESISLIFQALSRGKHSLHVEFINIRSTAGLSQDLQNDLDMTLSLVAWFMIGSSAEDNSADMITGQNIESNVQENTNLAGLFDQGARARFRSPSVDHYRLAAINVSKNSRTAIIANLVGGKTRRLKQGELLDAWLVESITSNGVTLAIGDKRELLTLSR